MLVSTYFLFHIMSLHIHCNMRAACCELPAFRCMFCHLLRPEQRAAPVPVPVTILVLATAGVPVPAGLLVAVPVTPAAAVLVSTLTCTAPASCAAGDMQMQCFTMQQCIGRYRESKHRMMSYSSHDPVLMQSITSKASYVQHNAAGGFGRRPSHRSGGDTPRRSQHATAQPYARQAHEHS